MRTPSRGLHLEECVERLGNAAQSVHYQSIHLEECVERLEKAPKVLITNAFTSAGDLFTFARAAHDADLANVPIESDCKNREDTHHDRLHEDGLHHGRNCMQQGSFP